MRLRIIEWPLAGVRAAVSLVADVVAPTDSKIRTMERMNADEFARRVARDSSRRAPAGVIALFSYRNDFLKTALVEIKDRPNRRIADNIGAALFAELSKRFPDLPRPIVAPIPISKKKRRARGWNQCDLVLDGFRKADRAGGFEVRKSLLEKIRDTEDQVGKSKTERSENVRGCFAVRDGTNAGDRVIIVVDDIVTTGATLGDARRALLEIGAKQVILVAVAH